MAACIYIIFSDNRNSYYVGCTEDLHNRLEQHNNGRNSSTKSGSPWQLVYSEDFATLAEARAREAAIKRKKSRRYIEWLINSVG